MIELGERVVDTVTNLKGMAIAKAVYLNGCIQYLVQPRGLKEEEIIKSEWIDEGQLETLEQPLGQVEDLNEKGPGGGIRSHP